MINVSLNWIFSFKILKPPSPDLTLGDVNMTHYFLLCAKIKSKVWHPHKLLRVILQRKKHMHLVSHNTLDSCMLCTQSEHCFVLPATEADSPQHWVWSWLWLRKYPCLRLSVVEVSFWPRLTTAIQCHLTTHWQKHKSCGVIKSREKVGKRYRHFSAFERSLLCSPRLNLVYQNYRKTYFNDLLWQSWIFSNHYSIFSVTRSFKNHSDILIVFYNCILFYYYHSWNSCAV